MNQAINQEQTTTNTTTNDVTNNNGNSVQTCLEIVQEAIDDLKGKNITVIDVRDMTEVMDYIVIAEATSKRHVKALADTVNVEAKKAGFLPLGREGDRDSDWNLIDIDSVVVHIMTPQARAYYDLEGLWSSPEALEKLAIQRNG